MPKIPSMVWACYTTFSSKKQKNPKNVSLSACRPRREHSNALKNAPGSQWEPKNLKGGSHSLTYSLSHSRLFTPDVIVCSRLQYGRVPCGISGVQLWHSFILDNNLPSMTQNTCQVYLEQTRRINYLHILNLLWLIKNISISKDNSVCTSRECTFRWVCIWRCTTGETLVPRANLEYSLFYTGRL